MKSITQPDLILYSQDEPSQKGEPLSDASYCDRKWVSMTAKLIGGAASLSSLMAESGGRYVPYASLLISPFYIYYTLKQAHYYFKTAKMADRIAVFFFWMGRGLGSIGTALSDMIKPFSGSAPLLGLSKSPIAKLVLGGILPIIVIVLNTIGGASQSWALSRSRHAYKEFKLQSEEKITKVENAKKFLNFLLGEGEKDSLERRNWQDAAYTSGTKRALLEERIEHALAQCEKHLSEIGQRALFQEVEAISNLLEGEMKRRMVEKVMQIVAAVMAIAAGIFFLAYSSHKAYGYTLTLASCMLSAFSVVYIKCIPDKRFARPLPLSDDTSIADTN